MVLIKYSFVPIQFPSNTIFNLPSEFKFNSFPSVWLWNINIQCLKKMLLVLEINSAAWSSAVHLGKSIKCYPAMKPVYYFINRALVFFDFDEHFRAYEIKK